jgi:hypothetical protein
LETALALLKELGQRDIAAFADALREKLPQLLAPLEWLERHLRPVLQDVEAETQSFILWAWQTPPGGEPEHRHRPPSGSARCRECRVGHLEFCSTAPPAWRKRLHSWLRPYLQIHRGMCRWLLPLLQTLLESP